MKNLSIRFILAVLVTGFTYAAFVSGSVEVSSNKTLSSPLSFEKLLTQSKHDSISTPLDSMEEVPIRKINYAAFRKSLLRHSSVYYANLD